MGILGSCLQCCHFQLSEAVFPRLQPLCSSSLFIAELSGDQTFQATSHHLSLVPRVLHISSLLSTLQVFALDSQELCLRCNRLSLPSPLMARAASPPSGS